MKFTTRQLVTMAVFGALWGMVEISLGSVLHAIKIPLTGLDPYCNRVTGCSDRSPVRTQARLDLLYWGDCHGAKAVQYW